MGQKIIINMLLTKRQRATPQPRVPAPKSKQRVSCISGRSSCGATLHLINFRFRSTADSANLVEKTYSQNYMCIYRIHSKD